MQVAGTDSFWEFVTAQPAGALPKYSYIASTLSDSTALGNPLTAFFIEARSADGAYRWSSAADSGYSVDNLPPHPLTGIGGYWVAPASVLIHWPPNTDTDFSNFAVYRGENADFQIGKPCRIGATIDTTVLAGLFNANAFFKVTAIDVHGNESEPVTLAPGQITGIEHFGAPRAAYLNQNRPNPFNPETSIAFGTSEAGLVTLRIYATSGRLVRTVVNEQRPAGTYVARWDGRDDRGGSLPSGVYVARMESVGQVRSVKLALVR